MCNIKKRGFTLVELLTVTAIIGILVVQDILHLKTKKNKSLQYKIIVL